MQQLTQNLLSVLKKLTILNGTIKKWWFHLNNGVFYKNLVPFKKMVIPFKKMELFLIKNGGAIKNCDAL